MLGSFHTTCLHQSVPSCRARSAAVRASAHRRIAFRCSATVHNATAHNVIDRPFGISRSPAAQQVDLHVLGVTVSGKVETETSRMDVQVMVPGAKEPKRVVGTGGTVTFADGTGTTTVAFSSSDTAISVNLAGQLGAFSGDLVRWPKAWPTAAEILLPTNIISCKLEAENGPCGYMRDFGLAMRGELTEGLVGDWHGHESEVTLIKTEGGKALYQVLGSVANTQDISTKPLLQANQHPVVCTGTITNVLLGPGDVMTIGSGVVHRVVGTANAVYKFMYHQGVGDATAPEGFPVAEPNDGSTDKADIVASLSSYPSVSFTAMPSGTASTCETAVNVGVEDVAAAQLGDKGVVVKRSPVAGTVMKLDHVNKLEAAWWAAKGEYMLTVVGGSIVMEVGGPVGNTVDASSGRPTLNLGNGIAYDKPSLPATFDAGITRVELRQGDTIQVHTGTVFKAYAAADSPSYSVVNYLAADAVQRGCEVLECISNV